MFAVQWKIMIMVPARSFSAFTDFNLEASNQSYFNLHCMSYKNIFLFDHWTPVSSSKSTCKSKNLTKNGLLDHIIPDLTNKEKSDNQTKKYFFKSPYDRYTLKVWKESVKSTLSWKGLNFQPNLAYLGVERTTFSKS